MSGIYKVYPDLVRDLSPDVLDDLGRPRVLPAAFWATTTVAERLVLGHRSGIYSFPTVELVDRLRELIAGRSAIEIGAGHGVLAEALGIPATDSLMQTKEPYRTQIYAAHGQPIAPYGPDVVECEASEAVRRFRPDVVIGCWVTHRYQPGFGGNEVGVDDDDVLRNCATYILVGNEGVHRRRPIWRRAHDVERPPYIYSRAGNGAPEFIATWRGSRRTGPTI